MPRKNSKTHSYHETGIQLMPLQTAHDTDVAADADAQWEHVSPDSHAESATESATGTAPPQDEAWWPAFSFFAPVRSSLQSAYTVLWSASNDIANASQSTAMASGFHLTQSLSGLPQSAAVSLGAAFETGYCLAQQIACALRELPSAVPQLQALPSTTAANPASLHASFLAPPVSRPARAYPDDTPDDDMKDITEQVFAETLLDQLRTSFPDLDMIDCDDSLDASQESAFARDGGHGDPEDFYDPGEGISPAESQASEPGHWGVISSLSSPGLGQIFSGMLL